MRRLLLLVTFFGLMQGTVGFEAFAQTVSPCPFNVGLVLDKATYNSGEKIQAVLSMGNYGTQKYAPKGFTALPFQFYLVFTDPDGMTITSNLLRDTTDPPPPNVLPLGGNLVQVEAVELVPGTWRYSVTIPNVHNFYTLTKPGRYSVRARIPVRTYPDVDFGPASNPPYPESYARLDHVDWEGHMESLPPIFFTLLAPTTASGTISVKVEKHTVGTGNHPGSTKEPINGMLVKVFNMSDGCVARFGDLQHGFSWQNYKPMWDNCPLVASSGVTDHNNTGSVSFPLPAGDYIIIGLYDPDEKPNSGDEILMGVSAGGLGAGTTMNKYLQLIVKADRKKSPAKYTVVTGSELMIIEPEYIEWDGSQELYPFVFESVGDWTVTTSVAPPEGFEADRNSLSADVLSQIQAVQFVITDVGSKWVNTNVEHRIKHGKKTQTVKSTIGVKLSPKLAKQKGLDVFGKPIKGK